jgi:hypothetical protein
VNLDMLAAAMFIRFARSPARIAPWRSRVARPGGGDALSRRRLLQRVREPVDRGAQSPGELGDPGLAQDIAGEHARRFVRKPADSTATGTKAFSTGSTSAVSIGESTSASTWTCFPPLSAEASAATTQAAIAYPKATSSPSDNSPEISDGKKPRQSSSAGARQRGGA